MKKTKTTIISKFAEALSLCPPEEVEDLNKALLEYMEGNGEESLDSLQKVVNRHMPLAEDGIQTNYTEFEDSPTGQDMPEQLVMIGSTVRLGSQQGVVLDIEDNVAIVECEDDIVRTASVDSLRLADSGMDDLITQVVRFCILYKSRVTKSKEGKTPEGQALISNINDFKKLLEAHTGSEYKTPGLMDSRSGAQTAFMDLQKSAKSLFDTELGSDVKQFLKDLAKKHNDLFELKVKLSVI